MWVFAFAWFVVGGNLYWVWIDWWNVGAINGIAYVRVWCCAWCGFWMCDEVMIDRIVYGNWNMLFLGSGVSIWSHLMWVNWRY